jgi:hypothetical protein
LCIHGASARRVGQKIPTSLCHGTV